MKKVLALIYKQVPSIVCGWLSGLFPAVLASKRCGYVNALGTFHTWNIVGLPKIRRQGLISRLIFHKKSGEIIIGKSFCCRNKLSSNSVGVFQRCFFNLSVSGSRIVLGDNVGISGSTISAREEIIIGDNVLIGSGCLITDSDSHPIHWIDRENNNVGAVKSSPIKIGDNVFIGARTIVLKGVTIGSGSVIGAGSVVTRDVPERVIAAGNPCEVIRSI